MTASRSMILSRILLIIAGGYFLFSAYAKTVPITYFEFTISNQLSLPHGAAAVLARLLIGAEAALGLCMVFGFTGKARWVLKSALLLTLIFTGHLLFLLFRMGDEVNCGCMGVLAPMRPSWSILKNILLLVALAFALRHHKPIRNMALNLLSVGLLAAFLVLPFMLFPVAEKVEFPAEELMSATGPGEAVLDYRNGRHMVSFMSLTCSHCRKAAVRLEQIKTAAPELPMQVVFYKSTDAEEQQALLDDFLMETKMAHVPYQFIDYSVFMTILQATGETGVPAIYWLDEGRVERSLSIVELNGTELEHWLSGR